MQRSVIAVLPIAAVAALGCAQTAQPAQAPKAEWKRLETKRFTLFYEGDDAPSRTAIAANEDYLGRLETLLGVQHTAKIVFYKYTSPGRKRELTGLSASAHLRSGAIHSIFWRDRHETVHVVMARFGRPEPLLMEGVAVYLSGSWGGMGVHEHARWTLQHGRFIPLPVLIDPKSFRSHRGGITYGEAGSFVGYLLQTHGLEHFKRLYADPQNGTYVDLRQRVRAVYGQEIEVLERAWLEYLRKSPSSRPGDEEPEVLGIRSIAAPLHRLGRS